MQASNELIWEKITTQNDWFVALNGDKYSISTDKELERLSIESVVFYPNKDQRFPYVINITTLLKDKLKVPISFSLFLSAKGELCYENTKRISLSNWVLLPFQDILFKRLDYITSGAISGDKDEIKDGSGINTKRVITRRSYFKRLPPEMGGKIITMRSPHTIERAIRLLKVRNINLYKIILERRALGEIPEDWFITYVEAIENTNVKPNDIIFQQTYLEDLFTNI